MYLPDRIVTPEFRSQLLCLIPGLGDNTAYWRLVGHLAFSAWRDWETGELFLPSQLLAMMEDRRHDANYSAWTFLEKFQADTGIQAKIRAHDWGEWRRVIHVTWPKGADTLLATERRLTTEERVLLSTGQKWRREHQAKERKRLQAEAIQHLRDAGCEDAYRLLVYLNGLAPNRFAAIKKYLPEAHRHVDAEPDIRDKEHQHNLLQAIHLQAQPFYEPVERSVRIFSINESVLRLHRAVRKIVTKDWITADLRSAQLAIVACLWEVPEVNTFLRHGRNIWRELTEHMGLEFTDKNKEVVKDALYMTVFGAGLKSLRSHFALTLGDARMFDAGFRTFHVMDALLRGRAAQLRRIRKEKGSADAYGRWLGLQHTQVPDRFYCYDNSRSILAQVAQTYELRLLSPVIRLAVEQKNANRGFTLVTWLHDGFTFEPAQRRDATAWKQRLYQAVQEHADALGIHTELEF